MVIFSWREAATIGPFGFPPGECIYTPHLVCCGCPDQSLESWFFFHSRRSTSSSSAVVEPVVLSPQLFCYIVVSVQEAGLSEDVRMNSVLCCEFCGISWYLQVWGIMQTVTFYFRKETSSCFTVEMNSVLWCLELVSVFFFSRDPILKESKECSVIGFLQLVK